MKMTLSTCEYWFTSFLGIIIPHYKSDPDNPLVLFNLTCSCQIERRVLLSKYLIHLNITGLPLTKH